MAPPVLEKVKEKVAGYEEYDRASIVKAKLAKVLLGVKVAMMVAVLVAFAVYDSQHPIITIETNEENPWKLPSIMIDGISSLDYCEIYKVTFTPDDGWTFYDNDDPNSAYPFYDCKQGFDLVDDDDLKKRAATSYRAIFTPAADYSSVAYDRFEMEIDVSCPGTSKSERTLYYTVYAEDSIAYYSDNVASCGYTTYISISKNIFHRKNGDVNTVYNLAVTGFALNDGTAAQLIFIGNTQVQVTTEETRFGLFKRIVTDAGGLGAVVIFITTILEFIALRFLFSEAEFYYPHELREMVLWIIDPLHKRASARKEDGKVGSESTNSLGVTVSQDSVGEKL